MSSSTLHGYSAAIGWLGDGLCGRGTGRCSAVKFNIGKSSPNERITFKPEPETAARQESKLMTTEAVRAKVSEEQLFTHTHRDTTDTAQTHVIVSVMVSICLHLFRSTSSDAAHQSVSLMKNRHVAEETSIM